MRYYFTVLFCVLIFGVPWFAVNYSSQTRDFLTAFNNSVVYLAAVVTHNPRSIAELHAKYDNAKSIGSGAYAQSIFSNGSLATSSLVRILIVPGHEPNFGGTEYTAPGGARLKERDMTVELAQDLMQFVGSNPHYQAHVTRDSNAWSPDLAQYFKDHWNHIVQWEKDSRAEMQSLVVVGSSTKVTGGVLHNTAPVDVATRLYGITKWANENFVDVVIHIHFNDSADHADGVPGKHTGFAIYVPAAKYQNSATTKAIAETVFERLSKYNPVSNLPGESNGIVDEPKLIAIGANDTSDAASMLIEYGYIYEPQFLNPDTRSMAIKDLAYQTYLGLQDFFDPTLSEQLARPYDTLILPHIWKDVFSAKNALAPDVYALQTALQLEGLYPPPGSDKNGCPRSGTLGPCTKSALNIFQNKYGVIGESGRVGSKTLDILNSQYGVKTL